MKAGLFRLKKSNAKDTIVNTLTFVENSTWTVPENVKSVEVFAVGGGGSGASRSTYASHPGNGGSGGQITQVTVSVAPGTLIDVVIGAGGVKSDSYYGSGNRGGTTQFGSLVIAGGGWGGRNSSYDTANTEQERSALGGTAKNMDDGYPGEDGQECPFDDSGEKYGAGGGSGCAAHVYKTIGGKGGGTGGGDGGYGDNNEITNNGSDASFYGAGGGGAAFCSGGLNCFGGEGFQGIIIIRLSL